MSCQVTSEKLMDRVKGWAMTLGFIQNSEVFYQKLQNFPPFLSSLLLLRSYDLFIREGTLEKRDFNLEVSI